MDDVKDNLAQAFTGYAADRMQRTLTELESCVARMSEEQMQARGGEHENSVVNLLLHMEGNLRQWVLHGVGGQADVRDRDEEFVLGPTATGAATMARLHAAIEEARSIIEQTTAARLLEITDPQPTNSYRNCTVLAAIAKATGHLEHHAGQVILLTKQRLGADLGLTVPRKTVARGLGVNPPRKRDVTLTL